MVRRWLIALRATRVAQGVPQGAPIILARAPFRGGIALAYRGRQFCTPDDVASSPPACDRWKIVRGRHGQRITAPTIRRYEPGPIAFEPQHLHSGDAALSEMIAEPVRHGSQILTDDDAAVATGFKRNQAQQIL